MTTALHCKAGHEMSGENVRVYQQAPRKVCRACDNERVKLAKRERKKLAQTAKATRRDP